MFSKGFSSKSLNADFSNVSFVKSSEAENSSGSSSLPKISSKALERVCGLSSSTFFAGSTTSSATVTTGSGSGTSSSSSILVGISKEANGDTVFSEGNSSSIPNILENADETSFSEISSPPKNSGRPSSAPDILSITLSKVLSKLSREASSTLSSSEGKRLLSNEKGSSFDKSGGVARAILAASSEGISKESSCKSTDFETSLETDSNSSAFSSTAMSSGGMKLYSSFQKESKGSIS